ncbi:MAG: YfhO family protein, partial [Clostridia bacterium]|nr:YfhO family protein [Clostridia bacterium]
MIRRYKSAFLSPIFVISIFGLFFYLNGFFPFGNNSVSWCDMTQQVIPLWCDFKDILSGKDGFLLNLQNAGGMNFLGVFFFFLSSPFTFLVVFFEKADIPLLMNIILVLKLCTVSATSAVYFEKRYSSLPCAFKILLSVSFAFCGYSMMFYQNIIWLDIMYLFPVLMLGIHSLCEKGKPWLLIFSL